MAGPVFPLRTAEQTSTVGTTRPYVLIGALPGESTYNAAVANGDWLYIEVSDGVRKEISKAIFTAPNQLAPFQYLSTSNAGGAVNWPASVRPVIRALITEPSEPGGVETAGFWAAVELGTIPDFGDLSEQVAKTADMGDLSVILTDDPAPAIDQIDLGVGA